MSFCGWYETTWEKGFYILNFLVIRKAWEQDFGIYIHWCYMVFSLHQNVYGKKKKRKKMFMEGDFLHKWVILVRRLPSKEEYSLMELDLSLTHVIGHIWAASLVKSW